MEINLQSGYYDLSPLIELNDRSSRNYSSKTSESLLSAKREPRLWVESAN